MHTSITSAALAALLLPLDGPQSEPPAPEPAVRMELVSDRVQIAPREAFDVAVRLTIPDGQSVGWRNPGDAGRATSARLTAPPGFRVEGPSYPAPRRLELGDGAVAYAYETEALLVFRVTPPASLAGVERAELAASAEWLARGPSETAGRAHAKLAVAVYPARDAAASDTTRAIERFAPLVPRPWRGLERASLGWRTLWNDTGEGAGVALDIEVEGATSLEFFPLPSARFDFAGRSVAERRKGLSIRIEGLFRASGSQAKPEARGVLLVEREGTRAAYELHD